LLLSAPQVLTLEISTVCSYNEFMGFYGSENNKTPINAASTDSFL
jgi:hypothetical protein